MKGVVFNLLEEAVRREYGEDTWDALLAAAQLPGVYTSLGNYADAELLQLVTVASAALHKPADVIVRWFGCQALGLLADKFPEFFAAHRGARSFLLTLNDIIHAEVRKIYPGADVPVFGFDTSADDVLVMEYQSGRKLCSFAEGLIEGAAAYFAEVLCLEHPLCMKRGDDRCVLQISLQRKAG